MAIVRRGSAVVLTKGSLQGDPTYYDKNQHRCWGALVIEAKVLAAMPRHPNIIEARGVVVANRAGAVFPDPFGVLLEELAGGNLVDLVM